MEIVAVELGERRYDIHVGSGLLSRAGTLLRPMAPGIVPIVTDEHVAERHLGTLAASLSEAGIASHPIILPPGETTKSFAGLERLISALLRSGVDRGGLIVALGGGVVGDLTGFASAVLKRGIAFVQIPTTLLSQVDSSVGGKTAINTVEGKNLVGVFHQPRLVIADVDTLATLPRRELLAGYAEVVKYGALGDRNFFSWLEAHGTSALAGNGTDLAHAVAHSCRMKAGIVERDERETAERALLNLGHTFGHALEAATGFSQRLLHGEGVAIGMVLAFKLSERLGHLPQSDTARLIRHLKATGLPSSIDDIPGDRPSSDILIAHMMHDKKIKGGKLVFVMVKALGQAFLSTEVPIEAVHDVLAH